MKYLNQNLFSLNTDREIVICLLLFEQRGKIFYTKYNDFFNSGEITYDGFTSQIRFGKNRLV